MRRRFYISARADGRPDAQAVLFCDGSADATFREGRDLELSHWIPNRTPARYRADTSTEICLRFAADPSGDFDLVVNNHVDVDGVLSVFGLVEPDLALTHHDTLVNAAEMGDFSSYGDEAAQRLFQGLALLQEVLEADGCSPHEVYEQCFERARGLLRGADDGLVAAGLAALDACVDLIDSGRVRRDVVHERFVTYVVPADVVAGNLAAVLRVPAFNAPLSRSSRLLPQARNRLDKERVQLVSVESAEGWYHDLWYPGYMWADTENVWRAPGLRHADSTNVWFYGHAPLSAAVDELEERETAGAGVWTIAETLLPFRSLPGRNFPVVVSFLAGGGRPAESGLDPAAVAAVLARAFVPR